MSSLCSISYLPVVLGLCTAVLFAFGVHCTRIGLRHTDSMSATMISIGASTGLYWLFAPWFIEPRYWLSPAMWVFAGIGLFRPLISANLGTASTRLVGPTIASTLSATSPLFGAALGVLILEETLTPGLMAGTIGIVLGVVALSWRSAGSVNWPLWALLLPLAAAMLRVLANVFAKLGMQILPSPYFAGLVGYSVLT